MSLAPNWLGLLFLWIVDSYRLGARSEVIGCSFLQTNTRPATRSRLEAKAPLTKEELWFHASSPETEALYKGCEYSTDLQDSGSRPSFVILGAQKAGTSSISQALQEYACVANTESGWNEVHLFDSGSFLNQRVPKALLNEYFRRWEHCESEPARMLRFEKSPSYYWQAWTPLRMCESLGADQRLVLFLRDPIARAYSSFYQSHLEPTSLQVPLTPEGFDILVRIEIAIVQSCGGLPSGDLQRDLAARATFSTCCRSVARVFNFQSWDGCECEVSNGTWDGQYCGVFGRKSESQVRMGIYAPFLRNWLQYFRTTNIYMYVVEESVFPDMERVVWELGCAVDPAAAPPVCEGHTRLGHSKSTNSASGTHPPMLNSTFTILKEFYSPFNHELEVLLGRDLPW